MKINSIGNALFNFFRPVLQTPKNLFPSNFTFPSGTKIVATLAFTIGACAVIRVASSYFSKKDLPSPKPELETPPAVPIETPHQEPPPPAASVPTPEPKPDPSVDHYKVLKGLLDQRKVPEKEREKLNSLLAQIAREEEKIPVSSFKQALPLICVCERARKDLQNPTLAKIATKFMLNDLEGRYKSFITYGTLGNTNAECIEHFRKNPGRLSPNQLIHLSIHFMESKSFSDAAYFYRLGIARMEKDVHICNKYPQTFPIDYLKIYKNTHLKAVDQLKSKDKREWDKALKQVKLPDDKSIPYDYDCRWVIFSKLWIDLYDSAPRNTPILVEGEMLEKACVKGLDMQSTCLEEFAQDPRFHLSE